VQQENWAVIGLVNKLITRKYCTKVNVRKKYNFIRTGQHIWTNIPACQHVARFYLGTNRHQYVEEEKSQKSCHGFTMVYLHQNILTLKKQ